MPDPEMVSRAHRAAVTLEQAWERWRLRQGIAAEPKPPVSSYVGYSIADPSGRPRVVFGVDAAEAEALAALLDGDAGPAEAAAALDGVAQLPRPARARGPARPARTDGTDRSKSAGRAQPEPGVHVPRRSPEGEPAPVPDPSSLPAPAVPAPGATALPAAAPAPGAPPAQAPATPASVPPSLPGPAEAVAPSSLPGPADAAALPTLPGPADAAALPSLPPAGPAVLPSLPGPADAVAPAPVAPSLPAGEAPPAAVPRPRSRAGRRPYTPRPAPEPYAAAADGPSVPADRRLVRGRGRRGQETGPPEGSQ
jgi:hypothetical protein